MCLWYIPTRFPGGPFVLKSKRLPEVALLYSSWKASHTVFLYKPSTLLVAHWMAFSCSAQLWGAVQRLAPVRRPYIGARKIYKIPNLNSKFN